MQLHNLPSINAPRKRVARGGKRGTYAGRGGKGQTARAGHRIRPALRDYLKQIPKRRGRHKNPFISVQDPTVPVALTALRDAFPAGGMVTPKTLKAKGLLAPFGGRTPRAKILGSGKLVVKLTVRGCAVSVSAKAAIEAAGGTVTA